MDEDLERMTGPEVPLPQTLVRIPTEHAPMLQPPTNEESNE